MILVGTGSEVQLAVAAAELLAADGVAARVVSMPCREWFDEQDQAYRDSVFPPSVTARVSVEAGISLGWREIVGDAGRIVSLNHYGASAAAGVLFTEFGFTPETVAAAARESLAAATETTAATATTVEEAASGPVGPADAGEASRRRELTPLHHCPPPPGARSRPGRNESRNDDE